MNMRAHVLLAFSDMVYWTNYTIVMGNLFHFSNLDNPVQKYLENAFFRSFSVICELFFQPSPISMLKIVIFVLHKVVLSR